MQQQTYHNHTRLVTGYHKILPLIVIAALIGAIVNVVNSAPENLYSASLILLLCVISIFIAYFTRSFSLRAQDRAIRAEENLRHYILSGKPLDSRLKVKQIIALRFASDDEFLALAKRAAEQGLSSKAIKETIQQWKGDYYRV